MYLFLPIELQYFCCSHFAILLMCLITARCCKSFALDCWRGVLQSTEVLMLLKANRLISTMCMCWKSDSITWPVHFKFGNLSTQLRSADCWTFMGQNFLLEDPDVMFLLKTIHHCPFHLKNFYLLRVNLLYNFSFDRPWTFCSQVT